MNNYTEEQLKEYAERLAVEVMGWYQDNYGEYYSCAAPNINLDPVVFKDNWRPWLNLSQGWMVVNAMYELSLADPDNFELQDFVMKADNSLIIQYGNLCELTPEQYARAIFDAVCRAMGWEE